MAKTQVSDVIVPEIYNAYVYSKTKELSNFINSGIAMSSPQLDTLAANGGKFVDMPLWHDLSGADEVLSDSTALTPDKITADKQVGVRLVRGRAWESADLAGILSGADPLGMFTTRVAEYRARKEQTTLVSIINGLFGTAGALTASNSLDISAGVGDAAKIGASSMLDAKQLLGDAAGDLTAVAMHSATYTALEKQNLIQFIPNSNGVVDFPRYMNKRIVIDDGMPVSGTGVDAIYTTVFFGNGAFGRGDGVPADLVTFESDRDILSSSTTIVTRWSIVLHPYGCKFNTGATLAGATPSNAELATPANWVKVLETKQIPMIALKHKI